jgi:hypothetical protein
LLNVFRNNYLHHLFDDWLPHLSIQNPTAKIHHISSDWLLYNGWLIAFSTSNLNIIILLHIFYKNGRKQFTHIAQSYVACKTVSGHNTECITRSVNYKIVQVNVFPCINNVVIRVSPWFMKSGHIHCVESKQQGKRMSTTNRVGDMYALHMIIIQLPARKRKRNMQQSHDQHCEHLWL